MIDKRLYTRWWDSDEEIEGKEKYGIYWKIGINECFPLKGKLYDTCNRFNLAYYSKHAYSCERFFPCIVKEPVCFDFADKEDFIRTKDAWEKELPLYILKRIIFSEEELTIKLLESDCDSCRKGSKEPRIEFCTIQNEFALMEEKRRSPDARELSR